MLYRTPILAVQVAHVSQFSWTYERYHVPELVHELLSSAP